MHIKTRKQNGSILLNQNTNIMSICLNETT